MAPFTVMLTVLLLVVWTVQGQALPTGLSAVYISPMTIRVYWTPSTATPDGYRITYYAGANDTTGTAVSVSGGNTDSEEISNLNPTVTYRISIVSVIGATHSDPTGPVLAARGPGLAMKGAVFPNHGVLRRDPNIIGEDDDALYCVTNDITCCGIPPSPDCCDLPPPRNEGGNGTGQGHWYFPNGNELDSGTDNAHYWYASWLTGAVLMNFRGTATTGTNGLHRCSILDNMGTLYQFYTCVYDNTIASQCEVTITHQLRFSLVTTPTADPPVFALTCISTGGPATTVTWTRDGAPATGITSQSVVDLMAITYLNTLTVTGRLLGNYQCRVTNDRTVQPATSASLNVAILLPSGLSAIHTSSTTMHVYWLHPAATPAEYEITYFAGAEDTTGTTVSISDGNLTSSHEIFDLSSTVAYSVSIRSVSGAMRSDTIGPVLAARGPGLSLKDAVLPNHSILRRDPSVIGEDEDALYCVTDDVTCCGTPPSPDCCTIPYSHIGAGGGGNGQGQWYFPSDDTLTSGSANTHLWYASWLTGAVLMNFRGTATTGVTGLFRCDIRDSTGTQYQFYTCIYDDTVASECTLQPITDAIQVAVVSSSPVQFTLTSSSIGGPATSVTWTQDGVNITYDSSHVLTQIVVDISTVQYSNILTVTGVETGNYQCIVSNALGEMTSPLLTRTELVPSAPTDMTVSGTTDSSVRVTWIAAPAGSIELLGYQVSFERLTGRGCDSSHADTIDIGGMTTDYIVLGLSGLSTYRFSVAAVNIFGTSDFVSSETIDILPLAITGSPTDVIITTSGRSITVSWSPVPCLQRNRQITSYVVRYTEVTSSSHITSIMSVNITSATIDRLHGSTRYSIEVAAVGDGETGVYSSPIIADETSAASTTSNVLNTIVGIMIAIVVLVLIAAVVPVIVWLVLKHNRAVVSQQKDIRNEAFGIELHNPLRVAYSDCAAYSNGVAPQAVEDKNHDYEVVSPGPLPGPCLPPTQLQGSFTTSLPQTNIQYANIRENPALQDRTAIDTRAGWR